MKLLRDPFLSRLLAALALYATLIGLWMHSPLPASGARADALSAPPHARTR